MSHDISGDQDGSAPLGVDRCGVACDNDGMTKTALRELVDGLPDDTLNGAAVLLRSLTERSVDADQAWFWTLDWLSGGLESEREAQSEPRIVYQDAESFKAALYTARSE
jgi:hypothetical protein